MDLPSAEASPEEQLLGDPRATKAILELLAEATIACSHETKRETARIRTADEWGLPEDEREENEYNLTDFRYQR